MKIKKQLVNIRVFSETDPTGELKTVEAHVIGDYSFRKEMIEDVFVNGRKRKPYPLYTITHNPSGLAVTSDIPLAKTARKACEALASLRDTWDGKDTMPRFLNDQVCQIVRQAKYGAVR